jgi:hypothetical protein
MKADRIPDAGEEMKALYVPVLAATALFSISGVALAQTWQAPANADPQAAPGSTMAQPHTDPSRTNRYENDATGPQPGGSSGSGRGSGRGRNGARCVVGLSCDIYQGS